MIKIYTDGSFYGGQSGYGIVYLLDDEPIIEYGKLPAKWNSNQKAELYAILQALITLERSRIFQATIYTDSQYSINSLTIWYKKWIKNNYKGICNTGLIIPILALLDKIKINFIWVPGHSGDRYNDMADYWAKKGAKLK